MSSSDALLLPRLAAGDDSAVAECVARYEALVWSLARRWCVDSGDAEDAVQEIFFDLWKTASRFDGARITEAGWVAMIARRRLIDRARRHARQPALDALPEGFDIADESEPDLDREERTRRARAVLHELSPVQRQILELSLLHGRTHEEIAAATDTPLGTVKSHIRRGIQRARALLESRASSLKGEF